jgi:hypothetical protein
VHFHPNLILSVGTQVVSLVDIPGAAWHDLLVRLRVRTDAIGA